MIKYPSQIDTSSSLPIAVDNLTPIQGSIFNKLREAVIAVEQELGVKPSASYSTVKARLDALESIIGNLEIIELAGDLGGTLEIPRVIGIQGFPVSDAAPEINDVLTWNGIAWQAVPLTSGGGGTPTGLAGGDLRGSYPNPTVTDLTISGETQGDILYRNNSTWTRLAAGTDGYVLTTHAAGSNPTWSSASGVAAPSGPAGGDLTGTYPNPTIAANTVTLAKFQTIATDSLLGRDTAGTGTLETISLNSTLVMNGSQVLGRAAISGDVTIAAGANTSTVTDLTITSEQQGSILYFNGSNWVQLAPNTDGYVLTTHSTSANPTWATVSVTQSFLSFFGSGVDGNLTASAGVTTLSRDTYYDQVTLTGTAQINCNGWSLFMRKFDASNAPTRAIYAAGADGIAGTTQGAIYSRKTFSILGGSGGIGGQGGTAGAVNSNGNAGNQPAAFTEPAMGGVGGAGGNGGNGNGGKTGGIGGERRDPTNSVRSLALSPIAPVMASTNGTSFQVLVGGVGGGGGGGGAGANASNSGGDGRGGGGPGGVIEVWIGELVTGASTPAVLIDSYGGACGTAAGTPSGGGGSGGGGGGGGGATRVFIGKRTGSVINNLVCATGGTGGPGGLANGGTAGQGGQAGGGGSVTVWKLDTQECLYKDPEVGAGPAAIGTAGGVPTVWGVNC